MDFNNKIFTEEANYLRICGYWKYKRYYERWYHWLKTGVWPKPEYVPGMIDIPCTTKISGKPTDKTVWIEENNSPL